MKRQAHRLQQAAWVSMSRASPFRSRCIFQGPRVSHSLALTHVPRSFSSVAIDVAEIHRRDQHAVDDIKSSESVDDIEQQLIILLRKKDPGAVLAAFKKLQESDQFSRKAYNLAISAHALARDADAALSLFHTVEAKAKGGVNLHSFAALASAFCRSGRLDDAFALLQQVKGKNLQPDMALLNTLLHGAVAAKRIDLADQVEVMISNSYLEYQQYTIIGLLRLGRLHDDTVRIRRVWLDAIPWMVNRKGGIGCSYAMIATLAVQFSKSGHVQYGQAAVDALSICLKDTSKLPSPALLYSAVGAIAPCGADAIHVDAAQRSGHIADGATSREHRTKSWHWTKSWQAIYIRSAFDTLASAYGRAGKYEEASAVFSQLEELGDNARYPTIIARLKCHVNRGLAELRKETPRIPPSSPNAQKAVDVLTRVEGLLEIDLNRAGLKPSTEVYNALLHEYARQGGLAAVRSRWQRLRNEAESFVPDRVTFATLLAAHAAAYDVAGTWDVWDMMKAASITPNYHGLTSLIAVHARPRKGGNADPRVLRIDRELASLNLKHDVVSGTEMARVLAQLGLLDEAFDMFQGLQDTGLALDTTFYNVFLKEYGRVGQIHDLLSIWHRLRMQRVPFVPNAFSFATLLDAHAAAHDAPGAWKTWDDMKQDSIVPDEACFVSLIASHAKSRKRARADARVLKVDDEMSAFNFKHTAKTGSSMVSVLAQLEMLVEARELIRTIQKAGMQLDTHFFNMQLQIQMKEAGLPAAVAEWERLKSNEPSFVPDRVSYGILLAGHAAAGDVTGAWNRWREMSTASIAPDESCVLSLIAAHGHQSPARMADARVLQVEDELAALNFGHTKKTGTLLARILARLGMLQEARNVLEVVQGTGQPLDAHFFNISLDVLRISGESISVTVSFFRDMMLSRYMPDHETLNVLMRSSMEGLEGDNNFTGEP